LTTGGKGGAQTPGGATQQGIEGKKKKNAETKKKGLLREKKRTAANNITEGRVSGPTTAAGRQSGGWALKKKQQPTTHHPTPKGTIQGETQLKKNVQLTLKQERGPGKTLTHHDGQDQGKSVGTKEKGSRGRNGKEVGGLKT